MLRFHLTTRRFLSQRVRLPLILLLLSLIVACLTFGIGGRSHATVTAGPTGTSIDPVSPVDSKRSDVSQSDDLWTDIAESKAPAQMSEEVHGIEAFRVLELNEALFTRTVAKAPLEFTAHQKDEETVISLPLPDGRLWRFQIVESPVLSGELAAQFPEIRSYSGQSIDEATATLRFSWTPKGLNAFVISEQGSFVVAPINNNDQRSYISYFTHDLDLQSFECLTDVEGNASADLTNPQPNVALTNGTVRRYRLAVSVTPEFIFLVGGGSDAGTVTAVQNYVNNVRAIYEREIGVSFNLVAIWNPVFFGRPLTNGDLGMMNQQNQLFLDNHFFNGFAGSASYDIGFAMGYSSQGPSGLVTTLGVGELGCACQPNIKAQGSVLVSGPPTNDYWGSVVMAHEIGHMFGGRHTFTPVTTDQCLPQADQDGRVEPGSGSTIMSYAAGCGSDRLFTDEPNSAANSYFHVHSLLKIQNHKAAFSTCGQTIATGNSPPVITNSGMGATIPALTPFTLTAAASDPDGHPITYAWEEWDPGFTIFRTYVPSTSPSRTFPSWQYILNNSNVPPLFVNGFFSGETLAAVTRQLHFKVTVRDNRSGGGGTSARDGLLEVNVIGTAGPFKVTQPNTPVALTSGAQTITWNVAGTNLAPIGTTAVRILLSTDGGSTFPTVLAESTPNDGTQLVTLPNVQTSTARIKVEAVGNIYFDVSDTNFSITNTSPNLTPYQPSGWSDKIVVSNSTGTSTDSSTLTPANTLYVDWAVLNNGTVATATNFTTKLFVDGVERNTWVSNPLSVNFYTYFQDYSIGNLAAGTHTIKIVADSGAVISESNESDNEYTKTITVVNPALANLAPFQPPNWSDKIVVSTTTGNNTDSSTLRPTDTLYIDWAAINNGNAATGATFYTRLFVDGVERNAWFSNPPLNPAFYVSVQDYALGSLSAGTHAIRVVVDATAAVPESNEADNEYTKTIVVSPAQGTLQLTSASYNVSEGATSVGVTVSRSDASGAATVNYVTSDIAGLQACTDINGRASERCDYVTSIGTVRFSAGETSKIFTIPIIDDVRVEGNETFTVTLSSPTGAILTSPTSATVTILDNDSGSAANPIDGVEFFIRQMYRDILNRQPDQTGLQNWINTLAPCPNGGFGEPPTSNCDRLHVAAGFFQSDEFLNRGYWAFRLYMVSLQQRPSYAQFIPDMAQVGGPKSPAEEEAAKSSFAESFVQRSAFTQRYGSLSGQALANALTQNAGLPAFTVTGGMTNGQILRAIAERQSSLDRFLTAGTVSILYFGFQRRDPDTTGYQNNLATLNANPNNLRHLIFIFIYSTEYRQRFGPP